MDSSTDTSFEEVVEESMMELIQRAEAFLSAHGSPSGSGSSGSANTSSSSSSHDNSTAGDSPLSLMLSSNDDSFGDESFGIGLDISGNSSSSSGSSAFHSLNSSSNLDHSGVSSVSSIQRTISEDCVLVPGPAVPVVDLCSPRVQRNLIRRIANSAPILDSITLDDTVIEPPPPEAPQPAAPVVNEYRDGPPAAKLSKEGPGEVLNLSQGAVGEPAIAISCPICFDSILKKPAASTICGHLFCNDCISQEIKVRKQCPLCKRKLARNNIHPVFFN
uniref:E3 ubiquitin-protein ligase RNF4 n=1 Tax=Culex pipiens TaxID=7175 RepID=A0A8D8CBT4_CULPI